MREETFLVPAANTSKLNSRRTMLLVEVYRNQLTDYYFRNRVDEAGPIHKLLALRNREILGHCYYRGVNGYRNHPTCVSLRE